MGTNKVGDAGGKGISTVTSVAQVGAKALSKKSN